MNKNNTNEEISAKNLRLKLWWLNSLAALIMMGAMVMLIVTPLIDLDNVYETVWSSTFLLTFGAVRNEADKLLNTFIDKYRKDHGLSPLKPSDNEGDK